MSQAGAASSNVSGSFNFNPNSVIGKDAVVVSVEGMDINLLVGLALGADYLAWKIHEPKRDVPARNSDEALLLAARKAKRNADPPVLPLEVALRQHFRAAGLNYLVVPLPWSRDTKRSVEAINNFMKWLPQVCAAAGDKPVYVIAHSWGTMLSYEVLSRLAEKDPSVRIDKYITIGSPLAPRSFILRDIIGWGATFDGVRRGRPRPSNVKEWFNFWARWDIVSSSEIEAAENICVDGQADAIEAQLQKAIESGDIRSKQAAVQDQSKLLDTGRWHTSYYMGFNQNFPSINATLNDNVFDTYIIPKL